MAGSFSETAYKRLPVSIRRLERDAQTVCIHLRLRRSHDAIARETGLNPDKVERLVASVRSALIADGNYDMISDPVFIPLPQDDGGFSVASEGPEMEEKVMAGEFISALKSSLAGLPSGERRLLHLFFERRMSAGEILKFGRKTGAAFPGNERDLVRSVEKALRDLLDSLGRETKIGRGTLTVKGLKEVLDQTGVEA